MEDWTYRRCRLNRGVEKGQGVDGVEVGYMSMLRR